MPLGRLIEFIPGTKAEAGEVNYNFNMVKSFVDGLEVNLTDVTNDIAQLETSKANTNGDYRVRFSVANPLNNYDAVNLQTFNKKIGNSINIIYGLGITKVGNNTIMVGAGSCYDSTVKVIMSLSVNISKTNSTQGANTTYYVYLIAKENESTDVLIVQNAANPPLPSEYVYYRLIGSYTTNSSNVITTISNSQITQTSNINSFVKANAGYITKSVYPSYAGSWSVGSGWVATNNGWIVAMISSDAGRDGEVSINNVVVIKNWQGRGDGRAGGLRTVGIAPISVGQTLRWGSNGVKSTRFYPNINAS